MFERWRHLLGGMYVEVSILILCGLILSETGKTRGPVFDAIGPDVLPAAVAAIVAALTLLQIVRQIVYGAHAHPDATADAPIHLPELLRGLVFATLTVVYVTALASRLVPFWAATAVFAALATIIMTRPMNWRDAVLGACIGTALGVSLQIVFTMILVIDLPT